MQVERYILRSQASHEREACVQLAERGIPALAPRTRAFERKSRKRVVTFDQPVFHGYVFADIAPEKWPRLREVACVSPRPLSGAMADRRPRPMTRSESGLIDTMVLNPPRDPRDPHQFKRGDKVIIADERFKGLVGTVDEIAKGLQARIKVLAIMMGRLVPIWLDREAVMVAV